jgi:hypothetical protein
MYLSALGSLRGHAGPLLFLSAIVCAGCNGSTGTSQLPPGQGLYAGAAERELDIPVGVPQSGYGARYRKIPLLSLLLGGGSIRLPDERASPYADGFFPTIGMYTRPNAKCVSLEIRGRRSAERLVICRVELAFVTDVLRRRVLEIVKEKTGADLATELLLAATHTHAAGGRFWRLPYFSDLASDTFHPEIFERLAWSIAQAIIASLEAEEPARIGIGILKPFDPRDALFRDRRILNNLSDLVDNTTPWKVDANGHLLPDGLPDGPLKDDQLTILRVDRRDGSPYALLFHFPVHGTTFGPENLYMSSDISGAIEHQVELSFESPLLAMHIQGAAGDIEPSSVKGQPSLLLEAQGRLAAARIVELSSKIPTIDDPQGFSSFSKDTRQDYDLLGYRDAPQPYSTFDAVWGAAQCGVVFPTEPFYCLSRPKAHLPPYRWASLVGEVVSAFLCHEMGICSGDWAQEVIAPMNPNGPPYEQPPEVFHTQVAAALLRGLPRVLYGAPDRPGRTDTVDLVLLGFPGEPTTPLSWQAKGALLGDLRNAGLATGPEEILVCGYLQDYFGYLLTPEDWLTGGYEISINLWGPLWGDFIANRTVGLAHSLASGILPVDETQPRYAPVTMEVIVPEACQAPPSSLKEPEAIRRFETATFSWRGGDPGVDRPRVFLQEEISDGVFRTVRLPNGLPYDDSGPEIVILYNDNHIWTAYWEAPWDFPRGTYRFLVEGDCYAGGPARTEPPFFATLPYSLASQPFSVSEPPPLPISDIEWSAGSLSGRLEYPRAEYDNDPNTPDGSRWRPPCPDHVSGTLTFTQRPPFDGEPLVITTTLGLDGECRFQIDLDASISPDHYVLDLSLEDPHANSYRARVGKAPLRKTLKTRETWG